MFGTGCLARHSSGEWSTLAGPSPTQEHIRRLFPTHNPTHRMRILLRLTRCLAVPAVMYVVVKPNHVTLIRARSVVQVHPGPPFKPSKYAAILPFPPVRGPSQKDRFVNRLSTSRLAGSNCSAPPNRRASPIREKTTHIDFNGPRIMGPALPPRKPLNWCADACLAQSRFVLTSPPAGLG